MSSRMGWAVALLAAAPLAAQERVEQLDLPRSVANEIIEFFNRETTTRFQGTAEVPSGSVIEGDVGVLSGPFTVAGEVLGDVVVVNGDLEVLPGGRVSGDVTVIGGQIVAGADAVGGQVTVYSEGLRVRSREGRIARDEGPWAGWRDRHHRGSAYISVRNEGSYNRVEGLPVMVGPVFRSEGEDFLRADVMAIWRSDSGVRLDSDELGYFIRAEQHLGPGGRYSVGGTFHSTVAPIEEGGLTDTEASLATFLLGRDYRDHYEREGFSAFLRFYDEEAGVRLTAEYRNEDHAFAPVGDPWSFKDDDTAWRPQPLVATGSLRTLGGELVVDDRNDRDDPSDGWYLAASATAGLGGGLEFPAYSLGEPAPPSAAAQARPVDTDFTAGSLDLRRYTRLGPGADLRLRGFVAGSVDGDPLPPQFQRALGGEGSLPGFPLLSVDCGARASTYSVLVGAGGEALRTPVYAGYGCDRVALFQAEYRGSVSFDMGLGDDDEWDEGWGWAPSVSIDPSWSVFFDAGHGWSLAKDGTPGRLGPDSETLMDVGVGFFLGDIGLYWAWPLNGEDRDSNFFVRLSHRF
ncbi:MAG TPA: polymer-forming cytoskeletal protein [Longimicrobiales bacterium]|nr:polymer-forming cytoskeletal protein [Longimicrobiales bacterium]